MNVAELLDLLQDVDPEAEVRLATQPNYPLEAWVAGVSVGDTGPEEAEVVWILEGGSEGYASRELWEMKL